MWPGQALEPGAEGECRGSARLLRVSVAAEGLPDPGGSTPAGAPGMQVLGTSRHTRPLWVPETPRNCGEEYCLGCVCVWVCVCVCPRPAPGVSALPARAFNFLRAAELVLEAKSSPVGFLYCCPRKTGTSQGWPRLSSSSQGRLVHSTDTWSDSHDIGTGAHTGTHTSTHRTYTGTHTKHTSSYAGKTLP